MPSYPLHGVVLRKTKLGETDLIISLLAAEGRGVRAVAKGARKPGGRLTGKVEPYTVLDLLLHTGRSLEVVQDARITAAHALLREDFERSSAAAVIVDVVDRIVVEGQAEPRLFELTLATLDVLETAQVDRLGQLVAAFLVKAMAMHGYRPELDACAACAGESPCAGASPSPGDDSVAFSLSAGGVLCRQCGELDATALRVPRQAPEWIRYLLRSTLAEIEREQMSPAAVHDTLEIMRAFVVYHTGARPKALDFFCAHLPA